MITAIRMIKMNPANVPPMMKISEMESRPDPLPSAIQNSVKLIQILLISMKFGNGHKLI